MGTGSDNVAIVNILIDVTLQNILSGDSMICFYILCVIFTLYKMYHNRFQTLFHIMQQLRYCY